MGMMTQAEAKHAAETLQDVFTPDGDAAVVSRLHTFTSPSHALFGKGQCAKVTGRYDDGTWYPITELTK